MKQLLKLVLIVSAVLTITNCGGSPSEQAMKKADKYFKMAEDANKEGKRRAYRTYANKGLLALSKYMGEQKEIDTVVANYYVKKDTELGLEILKNYAQDKNPQEKISSFYEELNAKVFITKLDTMKVKNSKGKEITKIKKIVTRPLSPIAYQQYSTYLAAVADTLKAFEGIKQGFVYLMKANDVDSTNPVVKNMFGKWKKELAKYNLDEASDYYDAIKDEKEPEADDAIAAEYFTRVALKYDPTNKEANEMIKVIRPKMSNIYSAYVRLTDITGMASEEIDADVDNNAVLIAFLDAKKSGANFNVEISIYNNSYNAIEIRPDVFHVEDAEGNKYPAVVSSTNKKQVPSKILDTEWEERGQLSFKVGKADIVKIVYDMQRPDDANGGVERHFAEKYLK